jgi:hypothetical protein
MAWMTYGNGLTRFDPDTGKVQVAGSMGSSGPGDWRDIGNINDPWAQQQNSDMFPAPAEINMMKNIAAQAKAAGGATGTPGMATTAGGGAGYYGGSGAGATSSGAGTQTSGAGGGGGGATNMATTTATQIPTSVSIPQWQQWYNQNIGKTILVNGNPVTINQDINPNQLLSAFQNNQVGWGQIPGPQAPATEIGGAGGVQPESVGLAQMAQIDPSSELLRQGLAASYLSPLINAANPTAQQFQSYLDMYGQVDPTTLAARQKLGSDLAAQEALGSQLDPETAREIEQQVRAGQTARGNVYGTPQLVQEAMTRGQAGLALQQQRQQMLGSYLQSGISPGDVALNLYQMQQNQLRAAQAAAQSYLGSGTTPYQAGASYLNQAEQRAAAAAQGGAAYMPQGPSGYYTGAGTSSFPQYGIDMSQLANQWMQGMNYGQYQGYALTPQKKGGFSGGGAASGALSGAGSGALAGSALGPWGTVIGGVAGGIMGGLGGGFSG